MTGRELDSDHDPFLTTPLPDRSPDEAPTYNLCSACGQTVPAAGDLAQWQKKAEQLVLRIRHVLPGLEPNPLSIRVERLRAHLAAMPAQDPNAELLGALKRIAGGDPKRNCVHIARAAVAQAEKGAAG